MVRIFFLSFDRLKFGYKSFNWLAGRNTNNNNINLYFFFYLIIVIIMIVYSWLDHRQDGSIFLSLLYYSVGRAWLSQPFFFIPINNNNNTISTSITINTIIFISIVLLSVDALALHSRRGADCL